MTIPKEPIPKSSVVNVNAPTLPPDPELVAYQAAVADWQGRSYGDVRGELAWGDWGRHMFRAGNAAKAEALSAMRKALEGTPRDLGIIRVSPLSPQRREEAINRLAGRLDRALDLLGQDEGKE